MRDKSLAENEYLLNCSGDCIDISYSDSAGLFYALVSLSQLMYGSFLQTARISDRPDYKYRGIMLDTARHYIPIEKIKAIIRSMAFYKLNFLHLHLTDDQGWRVEIKAYPSLAERGSIRGGTQIKKKWTMRHRRIRCRTLLYSERAFGACRLCCRISYKMLFREI